MELFTRGSISPTIIMLFYNLKLILKKTGKNAKREHFLLNLVIQKYVSPLRTQKTPRHFREIVFLD